VDDVDERQTGHHCERVWVVFESKDNDEPKSEVSLKCNRVLNRYFSGKAMGNGPEASFNLPAAEKHGA
jgi:hypothetical protein